jgi:hypothetical protein
MAWRIFEMDHIDRSINKILRSVAQQNREEARLRRNARDHDSQVNVLVDELTDRVNFRFPIKPREQVPQLNDAAYAAYQLEQIKNRSALLHILTMKILAHAIDKEQQKADDDFDQLMRTF